MLFVNSKSAALWTIAGVLGLFLLMVMFLLSKHSAEEQIASKSKRLELVDKIRVALASVSEAQNSAIMASAEKDSHFFVTQARAAGSDLVKELTELKDGLIEHGDQEELKLMEGVGQSMHEFQQFDKQLMELAVQNTNRKAYALTVGPAAQTLQQMDAALSRIIADHVDSVSENGARIMRLAGDARVGVLRIRLLLFPHIAEAAEEKMDELEAQMAVEDQTVLENLKSIRAWLPSADTSAAEEAETRYEEFGKLRLEIIRLSRENTNVRSLAIALSEKRTAMLAVQDSLAALENAIRREEIIGR